MLSYSMVYGMTPALWVSGSQYNVGNIVLSQIDWQQYIRITNGAGTTDPSADTTNYRPAAPRVIKLIQRGVATPSGSSELVVTVSAFNPARAVLNLLTYAGNTVEGRGSQNRISLRVINSTSIGVSSSSVIVSLTTTALPCSWELIEYFRYDIQLRTK